jgi:hypothetical protein
MTPLTPVTAKPRDPVAEQNTQQQILRWFILVQASLSLIKDQKPAMIAGMVTQDFMLNWPRYANVVYGGGTTVNASGPHVGLAPGPIHLEEVTQAELVAQLRQLAAALEQVGKGPVNATP